jgi:hypothetical protein
VARRKGQEPERGITRVTIRMPSDLHSALLQRREETGHSLNDLLIEASAKLLGLPVLTLPKGVPGPKPGRKKKSGPKSG